jgi:hypothetical protein
LQKAYSCSVQLPQRYKRNELFPTLRIALVAHSEQKQTLGTEQPGLLSQFVTDNESLFLDNSLILKHLAEFVLQFLG